MSTNKEQRIKKLTKRKIWRPIVFFIVSVLISGIMVVACEGFYVTYLMESRFEAACENASEISGQIDDRLKRGESLKSIVTSVGLSASRVDALVVVDREEMILESFGVNTADLDDVQIFEGREDYYIYEDIVAKKKILRLDGTVNLDMKDVASAFFKNPNIREDEKEWYYTELVKVAYWIGVPVGNTDKMVIVKSYIDVYNREVAFIFGLGAIILVMLFIPLLFLFVNIITNVRVQKRMTTIICTDTVTGGKNWFYFENVVAKMLEKKKNAGKAFTLVDITLMKYRSYCACYGVKQGETLLEQMDQYLSAQLQKGEYCAHFGKSQFVILIKSEEGVSDEDRIRQWMKELPDALEYSYAVFHAGMFRIEPLERTNGTKRIQRSHVDVAQLYNNASAARAAIKGEEDSAIEVFDIRMLEEQIWSNKVAVNMHAALENEEFKVYLQPKYNPVDNSLAGAEALVRWISPTEGFISPGRFIPIFETNGFITKLDDYMISHVAALQAKWLAEGKSVVPVSVNVSRAHFMRPDLAEHIARLVDAYQVPHHLIEIELTESAFFDDKTAILSTVNKLKENGFEVSMDDFGSGYSSLNSLKELPLDILKLDAEFFRGEYEKERGEIVVSEAINLAKRLNMRIVAEGVEEKEQVDFLAGVGCDMIQGFYYAKPMPAEEYVTRLG